MGEWVSTAEITRHRYPSLYSMINFDLERITLEQYQIYPREDMKTAFSGFHIPPTERHLCTPNNIPLPFFQQRFHPFPPFPKDLSFHSWLQPHSMFLGAGLRSGESPLYENPLRYNEDESSFITNNIRIKGKDVLDEIHVPESRTP
ncbi:hypothetical protein HNY73_010619 [Argiope bruennichi]|uniref:Uncharacterized protein n=1 Tax=Argiope bruennichi TaxID=94029 RepID=A0A8T0F3J4_ARGBR|nr:hypothetical protein HNY73_010619 [Argiope bruennichi]